MLTIKDIIRKRIESCRKQLLNLTELDYDKRDHIGGLKSAYEEMLQDSPMSENAFYIKYDRKAKLLQEMLQEDRDNLEELDGKLQGVLDILQMYDPEYSMNYGTDIVPDEDDIGEPFYGRYY